MDATPLTQTGTKKEKNKLRCLDRKKSKGLSAMTDEPVRRVWVSALGRHACEPHDFDRDVDYFASKPEQIRGFHNFELHIVGAPPTSFSPTLQHLAEVGAITKTVCH